MSFMDQLNQMARGAKAAEGGGPHPVGTFPGMVTEVAQKTGKNSGAVYWDLTVKTKHGTTWIKIFDITADDVQQAGIDRARYDQLLNKIARYKRYFVDLKVAAKETVDSWDWNNAQNPQASLCHNLHLLQGRPCTAVVSASTKDPGQTVTFMNAPAPGAIAVATHAAVQQQPLQVDMAGHGQIPVYSQPAQAQAPQGLQPKPYVQPGSTSDFEAIPF